jgi:radical SAM superfamily enzyme YgiQ (UPF0313 family)
MKKAVLVRPPTVMDTTSYVSWICAPIGLAYLAAAARRFPLTVSVADAIGNSPIVRRVEIGGRAFNLLGQTAEELAASVDPETDLVLFSIMFSSDWPYARKVLAALKARCPRAKFVAGSEHATAAPEHCLASAPELDLCVLGEGEAVLENLLRRWLADGVLPENEPGTCARSGQNPRRERVSDLGSLPRPDWDGFPVEAYLRDGFGVNRGRTMPILATRGCPYQCTFCSSPRMWTTAWKARDPRDVVDEMKDYARRYGAENFDFYDLTTAIRKEWMAELAREIIGSGLRITWQLPSGTRSEAIDGGLARLLYASGCRNFCYAPESGSEEILARIKKKVKPERMLESIRGCAREGLSVKANIVAGFPGETWRHLRESLSFIARMAWAGADDLCIFQFTPYPGSELFEELSAKGLVRMDDEYFGDLSFQTSMSRAKSYGELSARDLILYKFLGTGLFYAVSFFRRPWKLARLIRNAADGREETRLDKVVRSYAARLRALRAS